MAIRYIVNEKDRIVIAMLTNCSRDAVKAANAWTGCLHFNTNLVNIHVSLHDKYLIPNKFIGIARCSEEDVWDENIGKKINADIELAANRFNERVGKLRETK